MFMATRSRFPPAKASSDDEAWVLLIGGLRPITAINGKEGGGSYTVNEHGDVVSDKVMNLLACYREKDKKCYTMKYPDKLMLWISLR